MRRNLIRGVLALVAVCGCGGSAGEGSLGGIGLYPPRGDRLSVAVNTRYPSSEDDHAADFRRFHWLSFTLAGRTAVARDVSWEVDKTSNVRDTTTSGISVWTDKWSARLRGEATAGGPPDASPIGSYDSEYSCRHPLFNFRGLTALGER